MNSFQKCGFIRCLINSLYGSRFSKGILILKNLASALRKNKKLLVKANKKDVKKFENANGAKHPMIDRLLLNDSRIENMVTEIENCNSFRVVAEPAHGLCLAFDASTGRFIQFLGLYESESDIPVQHSIMGQINLLLTTLPQESLDCITAVGEGDGEGRR